MEYKTLVAHVTTRTGEVCEPVTVCSQPAWAVGEYLNASTRRYWRNFVLSEMFSTTGEGYRVRFEWISE